MTAVSGVDPRKLHPFFIIPDICISLSIQASETYLLLIHPFPLVLSGGIRGIHGARRSFHRGMYSALPAVGMAVC